MDTSTCIDPTGYHSTARWNIEPTGGGLEFGVWGLGIALVWGLGVGVWGSGFGTRVHGCIAIGHVYVREYRYTCTYPSTGTYCTRVLHGIFKILQ